MKVPRLTQTQEKILGGIVLVPFFSAGAWAMWQEALVGRTGSYSPTKYQTEGVAFKGATRYVTPAEADAYNLSKDLFNAGFLIVIFAVAIGLFFKRIRDRSGREA